MYDLSFVYTSCTIVVQENAAMDLIVLQSAKFQGLIICFAIYFLCVKIA